MELGLVYCGGARVVLTSLWGVLRSGPYQGYETLSPIHSLESPSMSRRNPVNSQLAMTEYMKASIFPPI